MDEHITNTPHATAAMLDITPVTLRRWCEYHAESLRAYAKQAGESLENQNLMAEIKLRAERRAGEILQDMEKATGAKGQLNGRDSSGGRTVRPPEESAPTLAEDGNFVLYGETDVQYTDVEWFRVYWAATE